MVVILGTPAQQLHHRGIKQWCGVDDFLHHFERMRLNRAALGVCHHRADRGAASEWHPHARAHGDGARGAPRGRQIIERGINGDLQHGRRRHSLFHRHCG